MTAPSTDLTALASSLSLEEKVRLLTGATTFTLAPEPSIGLGELRMSDGPTGVRGLKFTGGPVVSLFPNATLLASAWDETSIHEVGRMLAEEAMAQELHMVLGPTINLHRTPLGGRLFEAYSEDPLLTGRLAAAYVRGMQEQGIAACLKHLVANESETLRNTMNSVVDEATLRELYLLPFEIAVQDGDAWSIMAAYNDVNGVAATEQQHVQNEIVKGEWGWDGLIVSDWFATKTTVPSAAGGLDLVMPGPGGPWGEALVAAVRAGELPEPVVDDHVVRLLRLAGRVGVLGVDREFPADLPTPTSDVRREQLTRLAAQGMTVLTNGGVLPLARDTRLALVGRHALDTIGMGGGSAQVNAPYQVSLADALTGLLGEQVSLTDGVEVRSRDVPARRELVRHPATGEAGIQVTVLGENRVVLDERHSLTSTALVGFDDGITETVRSVTFAALVDASGAVEVGGIGAGDWTIRAGENVLQFSLHLTHNGFGEEILAPPNTHRTITIPTPGTLVEATVVLPEPEGDDLVPTFGMYGLVARPARRPSEEIIADAVSAARDADVAVVVVGLTEEQETEAVDKATLALPGDQDALVRAVAAAASRTVVVVNAATPVLMPWLDEVDAVLVAGLPGQEAGHAIAAALLGDIEPAGRLVTTYPAADGATPAWSVTPDGLDLAYTEGPFIGYRGHHAGRAPAPLFWFGHGLGYSTWEYGEATVTGAEVPQVSVPVTNTGARRSREVVQVYLVPAEDDQPVRLAGWAAAEAEPGETVTVTVATDPRVLRRWDTAAGDWARLSDGGVLVVARGLGDVRAEVKRA